MVVLSAQKSSDGCDWFWACGCAPPEDCDPPAWTFITMRFDPKLSPTSNTYSLVSVGQLSLSPEGSTAIWLIRAGPPVVRQWTTVHCPFVMVVLSAHSSRVIFSAAISIFSGASETVRVTEQASVVVMLVAMVITINIRLMVMFPPDNPVSLLLNKSILPDYGMVAS
jgi:hypothetical protein